MRDRLKPVVFAAAFVLATVTSISFAQHGGGAPYTGGSGGGTPGYGGAVGGGEQGNPPSDSHPLPGCSGGTVLPPLPPPQGGFGGSGGTFGPMGPSGAGGAAAGRGASGGG